MEAIILAGGLGTRLRAVVPNQPKAMAKIGSRPFLEILLHSLEKKGFKRIILALGYLADVIQNYFGSSFGGVSLVYVIEEHALGTGGAIRLAMEASSDDHVYVFNGDTYLDLEVPLVEAQWQSHRSPILVSCFQEDVSRYGKLLFEGSSLIGFAEKGGIGSGWINAGAYVLNRNQLNHVKPQKPFSFETDYLQDIIKTRLFQLFRSQSWFIDIGIPEDYQKAQSKLQELIAVEAL